MSSRSSPASPATCFLWTAKPSALSKQNPPAWHKPLPFLYVGTGVETFFTSTQNPEPRSRRAFAFHRPATLAEWAGEWGTLCSEELPG